MGRAGLGRPGSAGGGAHAGCPHRAGGGKSGGRAPSSWRRRCRARGRRSPPPSSPLLPSGRAPRHAEDSRKREGRGPGQLCSTRGRHSFLIAAPPSESPRVGDRPRVLAAGPRERAPRIAAATTCLPHVASGPRGSRRAPGALRCAEWGARVSGRLSSPLIPCLGPLRPPEEDGRALRQYMALPSR